MVSVGCVLRESTEYKFERAGDGQAIEREARHHGELIAEAFARPGRSAAKDLDRHAFALDREHGPLAAAPEFAAEAVAVSVDGRHGARLAHEHPPATLAFSTRTTIVLSST